MKSDKNGQRMTGAQAIIASLEAEGVDILFGYPGGQAIKIYDALYDSKQLKHILTRHEQGATHAADGYARATGRPGVVLVTSGPGATNTVTGIATAYMDSVPMVVITGQVPTSVIGTDAFQESDITGITLPITKHNYLVKKAEDLPRIIREAFFIATTGRPGPVLIDVPSDITKAEIVFEYPETVSIPSYKPTYKGHSKQIKQAVELIKDSYKPILYVGGGIIASGAGKELEELAEFMQIPVTATLIGKGCFPEDHHLSLGMPGMHGAKYTNYALSNADLLIAVGARFSDRVTGKLSEFAKGARVIHIDIDPAEIGKNKAVDIPIVGDAKIILGAINEELHKTAVAPRTTDWLTQIDEWRARYPLHHHAPSSAIVPRYVFERLNELLEGRKKIITTEVGQHQMWAAQYCKTNEPRTFISSGGLGTMGFGLPAAVGAQAGCPDTLVVCIAGDGSIQMNSQEMATAAINDFPVKVVLLNNGCLGMVRQWQQLFYEERYSSTLLGACPDFVKLAEAYGWHAERVAEPEDVDRALRAMIEHPGPALLDVIITDREMVFPMVAPGAAIDDMIGATNVGPISNMIDSEEE
ncbi:MAG: biosynthetic-type acetolactate synthase large subunit [Actinobacteria bacterium]|nr:biosynthetic-type acetolactate synthase large subunit [Actinomycetota bacterium]